MEVELDFTNELFVTGIMIELLLSGNIDALT